MEGKGDEEVKEMDSTGSEQVNEAVMSKRALKKLEKRKRWLENKPERKAKEKEKKKKRKAEMKDCQNSGENQRKRLKKEVKTKSEIRIAFDMSFGDVMNQRDCGKSIKQLLRSYSLNRRLQNPLQMFVTGLRGQCAEEIEKLSGYRNWDMEFSEQDFAEVFKDTDKKNIVYLTSESENVLGQHLDAKCVYVIGGLVDHNAQKGLCHRLAIDKGIYHARFPIDENVDMKSRKVLTIDHVFDVIGNVTSEGKTWSESLLQVLPKRKGAHSKDTESTE